MPIMVFVLVFLSFASFAECPIDSVPYFYLHPFFEGKHWQKESATLNTSIPDAFCSVDPSRVYIVGTESDAVMVYSNRAGSLNLSKVTVKKANALCPQKTLTAQTPRSIPGITLGDGEPFYVVQRTEPLDTVLLIAPESASRINAYHIVVGTQSIARTDILNLNNIPVGASVTSISGDRAGTQENDIGIWIGGTEGLVRRFPRSNGSWSVESIYDITSTETVTDINDRFLAATSGKIYYFGMNNTFEYLNSVSSQPLLRISSEGAVGYNGTILIRSGINWQSYTFGSNAYHHFNLAKSKNGSAVQLLDTLWNFREYTYKNSPTTIERIRPSKYMSYLNSSYYEYRGFRPETLSVIIKDIDSNYTVPDVVLGTSGSSVDLSETFAPPLSSTNPAQPCSVGYTHFRDTMPRVILTPDSIVYIANTEIGSFDFACYSCFWSEQTVRISYAWDAGNDLTIKTPTDSIQIRYSSGTVSRRINNHAVSDIEKAFQLRIFTGRLAIDFPENLASKIASISIYDAAGRQLKSIDPEEYEVPLSIPLRISSTIVCVQVKLHDGTVFTKFMPFLR